MTEFHTATVADMQRLLAALVADGNPAQVSERSRRAATTTADGPTLHTVAGHVGVAAVVDGPLPASNGVRNYVLFYSAFRSERADNISHETIDRTYTLCRRLVSDAATFEPDTNGLEPDCISCRHVLRRLREREQKTSS